MCKSMNQMPSEAVCKCATYTMSAQLHEYSQQILSLNSLFSVVLRLRRDLRTIQRERVVNKDTECMLDTVPVVYIVP